MGVAFRDLVDGDEELYQTLRNASLSRDKDAPLYVSKEEFDGFQKRKDIRELRQQYVEEVARSSSDSTQAKRIAAKIQWTVDWLCRLRVAELRKAYFEEVDKLRSTGQSTEAVRNAAATKNPRAIYYQSQCQDAVKIGKLLEKHRGFKKKEGKAPEPERRESDRALRWRCASEDR